MRGREEERERGRDEENGEKNRERRTAKGIERALSGGVRRESEKNAKMHAAREGRGRRFDEDRASREGGGYVPRRKERHRKRKSDGSARERGIGRMRTRERGGTAMKKGKRGGTRYREGVRERARVRAGGRERERKSAAAWPAEGARRPHMCSETNVRSECRLLPIIRCRGVPLCARSWSADSVPRFYAARQPGPVRASPFRAATRENRALNVSRAVIVHARPPT